jgi:GT2 family glycosyltransferase
MDSQVFVRHCLNLTITICGLSRADRRVVVTFWEHFLHMLWRKPVPALAALYWHLTRRRVRARNRLRVESADMSFAYRLWIANNEDAGKVTEAIKSEIVGWPWRPRFSVIIHSGETEDQVSRSVASVEGQIYPSQSITRSEQPIGAAIAAADGDFVVPLRAGDELSEFALLRFAETLQTVPTAAILYGDEDQMDDRRRRSRPWFKPKWNEELFLAQDYLSSAVAIESSLATKSAAASNADLAALLVHATAEARNIVHVPHILVHAGSSSHPAPSRAAIVGRHVATKGATCVPGPYGTVKVEWPLPDKLPVVSMIIPTRDKLDILRPCVESLLDRTDYPDFEMLIVDNGSVETATAKFFDELRRNERVRVLTYDRPFNYSAINNFAVRQARGTFVCLLNNDTEVVEPAWLTELMRYAVRPEIGAAGAKLLYQDGSIQHAGVVVGIGDAAGHAHRFLPAGEAGYFRMAHVAQFVSAVTGACLLVEKSKFEAVGGLDEEKLAIAYNDVDFCLKLEAAGWRNVYVPHAVLVHHESKSRARDMAPSQFERYVRELAVLQERWGTKTYQDPLHNPNLDRYSETYVFRL